MTRDTAVFLPCWPSSWASAAEAPVLDAWLLHGLLGLIAACLLVLTAAALLLVRDARRTLRQVNAFLKRSGRVISGARRIVARADTATGRITRIVSRACAMAESALGSLTFLGHGNGAGEEPRSRYRR